MSKINKIKVSGTTYDIQDLNATKTVELTQAQYDALTTKDPNTFYIITDAQGGDLSGYYTKSETDDLLDEKLDVTAYTPTDLSNYYTKSETSGSSQISTALNDKIDKSSIVTSISSSSTDAQIPSVKAVYDKLGGLSLVKLTQAQYDALATKDSNTLYVIVD